MSRSGWVNLPGNTVGPSGSSHVRSGEALWITGELGLVRGVVGAELEGVVMGEGAKDLGVEAKEREGEVVGEGAGLFLLSKPWI